MKNTDFKRINYSNPYEMLNIVQKMYYYILLIKKLIPNLQLGFLLIKKEGFLIKYKDTVNLLLNHLICCSPCNMQ